MTLDMYGERVAEASALIREFAKVDYFHYFARDPESSLEAFIAMLDQAEEKGRQSQAALTAELKNAIHRALNSGRGTSGRIILEASDEQELRTALSAAPSAPAVEQQPAAVIQQINEVNRTAVVTVTASNHWNIDVAIGDRLYAAPQAADTDKVRDSNALMHAAINCAHVIMSGRIVLECDPNKPGNALSQLRERLNAAASMPAQAPVREVPGWQPIETAPKDGTRILVWLGSPWSNVQAVRWFESWQNWQTEDFPDEHDEYCGIGSELPTHWMPLPAAPVQQEGSNG